ncbi:MAG: response regulator transcription factor [Oxalobacter sp.]|nr:response regulator transcription factor [Oxalobacter sp.]
MKVYLADTGTKVLLKAVPNLMRAGFDCVSVNPTAGFHGFLDHHADGTVQGVFVLGDGLSARVRRTWVAQLREHYPGLGIIAVMVPGHVEEIHATLSAGVDDWVTSAVPHKTLVARIGVLMRMKYPEAVASRELDVVPYSFKPFPNRLFRQDQEIELTAREYEVARFFFSNVDQPVSRQRISEAIWHCPLDEAGRTVDTHISRVRSRLGLKDGAYGFVLEQIYGFGYQLKRI